MLACRRQRAGQIHDIRAALGQRFQHLQPHRMRQRIGYLGRTGCPFIVVLKHATSLFAIANIHPFFRFVKGKRKRKHIAPPENLCYAMDVPIPFPEERE